MNSELENLIEELRSLPADEQAELVGELERRMLSNRLKRMDEDAWAI